MTIGLNFLLISQWGLIGAAVAVLLTTLTIQLLRVIQVRVLLKLSPYDLRIVKPVCAALVAVSVGLAVDALVPATGGLVSLMFNSAMVVCTYVGVLLAQGLTAEDRVIVDAAYRKVRGLRRPR